MIALYDICRCITISYVYSSHYVPKTRFYKSYQLQCEPLYVNLFLFVVKYL